LAFALILNVNATSAATTNETSSVNTGLKTDLSSNMTSSTNTISATASKTQDKTIPKVIRTDPSFNGNVSSNKTIKITFSEAIKIGTGFIELRNKNGRVPTQIAINGNALYIKSVKDLINGKYVVYIHTGSVTDLAGNNATLFGTRFNVVTTKSTASSSIFNKYLVATSNCQSTSPTIKALAKQITGS
jgi:hypothetical protein